LPPLPPAGGGGGELLGGELGLDDGLTNRLKEDELIGDVGEVVSADVGALVGVGVGNGLGVAPAPRPHRRNSDCANDVVAPLPDV
jgi:hypothetical protein